MTIYDKNVKWRHLITAPLLSLFSQFLPVLRLCIKLTEKESLTNESLTKNSLTKTCLTKNSLTKKINAYLFFFSLEVCLLSCLKLSLLPLPEEEKSLATNTQ